MRSVEDSMPLNMEPSSISSAAEIVVSLTTWSASGAIANSAIFVGDVVKTRADCGMCCKSDCEKPRLARLSIVESTVAMGATFNADVVPGTTDTFILATTVVYDISVISTIGHLLSTQPCMRYRFTI